MATIIGAVLLPVMLMVKAAAICAGFALGSCVPGAGRWLTARRPLPGRFAMACLGALVAGLAWLVPVARWFFAGAKLKLAALMKATPSGSARIEACEIDLKRPNQKPRQLTI